MVRRSSQQQPHADIDQFAGPSGENPSANPFNVTVSVPESIQVTMVDASALSDYEVWFFIASLLGGALTGFIVAYMQAIDANAPSRAAVGWMTLLLAVLFLIAVSMAFGKRASLKRKGKVIKLKTTQASTVEGGNG